MPNLINIAAANPKLLPFRPTSPTVQPSLPVLPSLQPTPQLVTAKAAQLARLSPSAKLAHDARNTLCSLQMLAGLLAEPGVLQAPFARYAADLQTVSTSLHGLVDQLAALGEVAPTPLATVKQGPSAPTFQSAGDLLQSCEGLLQAVAGPTVAVHVSSERALPSLAIDEDELSRVLVNLVKNASEAMGANGGTVRVTARLALSRTEPAVLLHVSDNGPGIPAHALGQIFEPGFSSKRNAHGPCGLGLAIVRELVEAAGGAVKVASTRRRGTTFELRLPASPK